MKYLNDVSYKDCVGKVCKSLNSGDFKILKYNDAKNVEIQFLNTGFETVAQLGHIKNGCVKEQANKWKSQIDLRAYEALMNYRVEITD